MRKNLFFIFVGLTLNCFAIDFSSKYMCDSYDTRDGKFKDILTLKSIVNHSNPSKDLFTYSFSLNKVKSGKQIYNRSAISVGNNIYIYFKNIDLTKSSDVGTGLAIVS